MFNLYRLLRSAPRRREAVVPAGALRDDMIWQRKKEV